LLCGTEIAFLVLLQLLVSQTATKVLLPSAFVSADHEPEGVPTKRRRPAPPPQQQQQQRGSDHDGGATTATTGTRNWNYEFRDEEEKAGGRDNGATEYFELDADGESRHIRGTVHNYDPVDSDAVDVQGGVEYFGEETDKDQEEDYEEERVASSQSAFGAVRNLVLDFARGVGDRPRWERLRRQPMRPRPREPRGNNVVSVSLRSYYDRSGIGDGDGDGDDDDDDSDKDDDGYDHRAKLYPPPPLFEDATPPSTTAEDDDGYDHRAELYPPPPLDEGSIPPPKTVEEDGPPQGWGGRPRWQRTRRQDRRPRPREPRGFNVVLKPVAFPVNDDELVCFPIGTGPIKGIGKGSKKYNDWHGDDSWWYFPEYPIEDNDDSIGGKSRGASDKGSKSWWSFPKQIMKGSKGSKQWWYFPKHKSEKSDGTKGAKSALYGHYSGYYHTKYSKKSKWKGFKKGNKGNSYLASAEKSTKKGKTQSEGYYYHYYQSNNFLYTKESKKKEPKYKNRFLGTIGFLKNEISNIYFHPSYQKGPKGPKVGKKGETHKSKKVKHSKYQYCIPKPKPTLSQSPAVQSPAPTQDFEPPTPTRIPQPPARSAIPSSAPSR